MTVEAGPKCTAIRKAIVPAGRVTEVIEALRTALGRIVVGDQRLGERPHGQRWLPEASAARVLGQLGKAQA